MRILLGMLSHEGNSFSTKKSELIPAHCVYCVGDEIPARYRGTRTKLGGFIQAADEAGAELYFTQSAQFTSSGCVSKKAFETIANGIIEGVRNFKPDLVFLALHGACILEHYHDGEGLLLKMVREAAGEDCVIASSFDMHAYMSFDMVSLLNITNGYKTYPHVDKYERALEAGRLAIGIYKKRRKIYIAMTRVPLVVNAECSQTDREPIGPIIEESTRLEKEGKIISSAVSIMQPWMNLPYAGCTATVCAETPGVAVKYSCELAERIWNIRSNSQVTCTPVSEAIRIARAQRGKKPVLFIDSADSPSAGATSDSSYVAKALIEQGGDLKSIGVIIDKEAAAYAYALPEGAYIECELGFKENPMFGKPFLFKGFVERHCEPLAESGPRTYDFGKRVILRCNNVNIMVMENAGGGYSPLVYTSAGLELNNFDVLCVRSALQYREHYAGLYSLDILLDSPGASSPNLRSLPFDSVIWPAYPFDEDATFTPHTMMSVR